MTRKKKAAPIPPSSIPVSPSRSLDPSTVINNLDFDSLEDKIRGQEILDESETRKQREARDVKKKLDQSEVERRLQELRKKINKNS